MNKKTIIGIGGLLLCVLFFVAPLVQCSQDSSISATGLEISVGTGKLMGETDTKYPYVFLLLLLPIILVIVGLQKKPFDVLRNVSIGGLIAHIAFMIGAYVKLNSNEVDKGAFELTGFNWLVIGLYVGLIGFSQYCIKDEETGRKEREEHATRTSVRDLNVSGEAHRMRKQYDAAISDFTEALRLDPNNAYAYRGRGEAFRAKGQYDAAIGDFSQAIRLEPNSAFAYRGRGETYRMQKQYDVAIRDFTEAIRLEPNSAVAYRYRGEAYRMKGQYDASIKDFNEVLRLEPNSAFAYRGRGETYRMQEQYDAAINDFTKAIGLEPNSAFAFAGRGQAYENAGRNAQAIPDLEKAVSLDSNYEWVKQILQECAIPG